MKTLSIILKTLWLHMAGLFSVVAVYFLLIGIDQGIDVVVQCGEGGGNGFFALTAAVLWSYFLWYSGRILSYVKEQKQIKTNDHNPTAAFLHKHFPRLISFNCYVCLQAAIVSLPTVYDWNRYALAAFIIFHNVLYFLISGWLEEGGSKKLKSAGIILIAVYTAVLIFYPFKMIDSQIRLDPDFFHQNSLKIQLGLLFVLEILWMFFLVQRRKRVDKYKAANWDSNKDSIVQTDGFYASFMKMLGFREDFIDAEKNYIKGFTIMSVIALGIYLAGIFNIRVAVYIGSLAYVLLALGILVGVSSFVSFFSIRWSVNLFLLLLIWSFVIGTFNDPYQVRTIEAQKDFSYSQRPETKEYLQRWFDKKIALMKQDSLYIKNPDKKFDIYIVLSNGGASRAGYWAGYNMSRLQDISYQKNPKNSFKDHLLCIAGASGGTVGNASFYALLKAEHDGKIKGDTFTTYTTSFYRKDFLVYPLAHLLGPDLFQHIFPLKYMDDRGDALERSLSESRMEDKDETKYDTLLKWYFKKPLSEVFDQSGDLPLLYMNSTEVDNGGPGVMSNVKLASKEFKSRRTDMLELVDSLKTSDNKKTDIRFSTAAILSSRFPYVSPAAKIHNRYFVDGGYFDNSGAGTIFEFTQQLINFLNSKNKNPDYLRFTFHVLHFNNSDLESRPVKNINPVKNDLASPFITLLGIQGSNTASTDGVLSDYFEEQFSRWEQRPARADNRSIEYNLYQEIKERRNQSLSREEVFPMSWVLSEYQMARMRTASDRETKKNLKLFSFMN